MTKSATVEMAALDRQSQIAHGAGLDRDRIDIDAQGLAEHAERALHALGVVEVKCTGRGMQDQPLAGIAAASARGDRLIHLLGVDRPRPSSRRAPDGTWHAAVRPRH